MESHVEPGLFIVQLMHPGGEASGSIDDLIPWNDGDLHRRKFLKQPGQYLKTRRSRPISADLAFWGEWEPESVIEARFADSDETLPQTLHRPFFRQPRRYTGLQNTDPFVFGAFLYTICLQHRKTGPTQLAALAPGSLILFGSSRKGEFVLDTVLVVREEFQQTKRTCQAIARSHLSRATANRYIDVTLKAMYRGKGRADSAGRQHTLYVGAEHDDRLQGMFSFFPCFPVQKEAVAFARPAIRLPGIVSASMKQGHKQTSCKSIGEVADAWQQIVEQVTEKGLSLGVQAALPRTGP